jgi:hypothetical protein
VPIYTAADVFREGSKFLYVFSFAKPPFLCIETTCDSSGQSYDHPDTHAYSRLGSNISKDGKIVKDFMPV